jgi:hypothetical protein
MDSHWDSSNQKQTSFEVLLKISEANNSMVECQKPARSTQLRQGVSSRKAEFHLALA